MRPLPPHAQDGKSNPKVYSVPSINVDSYGNYEFWRWEYQRRNPDYIYDFDRIVDFLRRHGVDSQKLREKLSILTFKMLAMYKIGIYNENTDQRILEFMTESSILTERFTKKFGCKVKDYNEGYNSKIILQNAVADKKNFFQLKNAYQMPNLLTSLKDDGDELLLRFPKDIDEDRLAVEAKYQLVTMRDSKLDDDAFFGLINFIKKQNGDKKASSNRSRSNLSRSIGIYLYDYIRDNRTTKEEALNFFIKTKSGDISEVTKKDSCLDKQWLSNSFEKTKQCILQMDVLSFE